MKHMLTDTFNNIELYLYQIEFDDGDKRTNVPRRDVRTANEADQIERDRDPEVGDRVYAKFTNNQWYWGEISAITRKKRSHRDHFSVSTLNTCIS